MRHGKALSALACLGCWTAAGCAAADRPPDAGRPAAVISAKEKRRPIVLTDEARQALLDFQGALRESAWERAVARCTPAVQARAAEYASAEAFCREVLPVERIAGLESLPVCGAAYQGGLDGDPLQYQCVVQLPPSWVWSVSRAGGTWRVAFQTEPLAAWRERVTREERHTAEAYAARQAALDLKLRGLSTRLTPLQDRFETGGPMRFRLELLNAGEHALLVDAQQVGVNGSLRITDGEGAEVPYVAPVAQTEGRYRPVGPGSRVVLFDNLDVAKPYAITRPGMYTVQFTGRGLRIGESRDPDRDDGFPFCANRTFPSNAVRIVVESGRP